MTRFVVCFCVVIIYLHFSIPKDLERPWESFDYSYCAFIWQVLHSGEGPIHAVKWRSSLVAWANDTGVKVYDAANDQRITFIERPRGIPRPELLLPHIVWQVSFVTLMQLTSTNHIHGLYLF